MRPGPRSGPARVAAIWMAVAWTAGGPAQAHQGPPCIALPTTLGSVGVLADGSFDLRWTDCDDDPEDHRIDWYYAGAMAPTFRAWEPPDDLALVPIVLDIPTADRENRLTWDTSAVPSGSWWLVSVTHGFPFVFTTFSPGVVTVQHDGDPAYPAVAVVQDDAGDDQADESYTVGYAAFDPDGTGTVRVEATNAVGGCRLRPVADGLPAVPEGSVVWDTLRIPRGDWMIRATLTDARGLSAVAWSRYFVHVTHFAMPDLPPEEAGPPAETPCPGDTPPAGEGEAPDAGPADAGPADAGLVDGEDASDASGAPDVPGDLGSRGAPDAAGDSPGAPTAPATDDGCAAAPALVRARRAPPLWRR